MARKQLDELQVGGGATGVSMVPDATTKKTSLPNSKSQGDMSPPKINADQNGEEETDTENNTKPTGDMSARNASSISTKPSAASASMKEHIDAMFNGEELSEDFREKASTIFEAAVQARVQEEVESIEEEFAQALEEAVGDIAAELSAKLDDYMDYCVEQWMAENEVAIEHTLKSEITEEFMEGLKNLFTENYIEIPEEKLDVIEQLAHRVEELEEKLNSQIGENIELLKAIDVYTQEEVFDSVTEGLALTQVEKLRQLAEGISFDDAESYKKKLQLVKENYFPSASSTMLNEEDAAIGNNDLSEETDVKFQDASVKRYFSAISRTAKQ